MTASVVPFTGKTSSDESIVCLLEARHHDPFEVLGLHTHNGESVYRVYLPDAVSVRLADGGPALTAKGAGLFVWHGDASSIPSHPVIEYSTENGYTRHYTDPYTFLPQLTENDLHLFGEGRHWHVYRALGAHLREIDGVAGVLFAVWAPGAERVSVVGEFNNWDGRVHPMRVRGGGGVWELFIPELDAGELYKFEIRNRSSGNIQLKSDPYGSYFEQRPNTAAIVCASDQYQWQDGDWLSARASHDWQHEPMSVYEVHLGSWQRSEEDGFLNYRELAQRLVEHVEKLGFTHIELMPITEHPLDASWGYQATGYFAPTSRYGTPDDFRYFVDYCHSHGIGVLLDWVPAHFPRDEFALANFDGTPLYEHEDPRRGEHRDWGTLIYNYGRNEVRNFLVSSAMCWVEEFHIDGLRVDAVASILYLDYSREEGDWLPNKYGGNENLEAIDFIRELNGVVQGQHQGVMIVAEESTSWPQVSRPAWLGGLGFSMKWNMGWMHDTLDYFSKDPVHRHFHHDQLTFGLLYAFTENFVLPFSHDEVVHGKSSMIYKMPGDEWQRFANLRLLYTYMFTYPGKKLLFMGNEFGQGQEWNHEKALDWYVLDYPLHQGLQSLTADLNQLYRQTPALYRNEFDQQGFEWIDCHDSDQSILSYLRRDGDAYVIILLNFTPVPRDNYRIGVPHAGAYQVIFNSDSEYYGGSNVGQAELLAETGPWMNRPASLTVNLPPLAGVVLRQK